MKPKEMIDIIDKDIEALKKQMEFLEGKSMEDPEVSLQDLASVEFVEDLKHSSNELDTKLAQINADEDQFYKWVKDELGVEPTIEIDDEVFWIPSAVSRAYRYF